MARPATPTAIHKATGSYKKNPNRENKNEPIVKEPLSKCPNHLEIDEKKMWMKIKKEAPNKVLTQADSVALELAAILFAQFRREKTEMPNSKIVTLMNLLGQFGMNPSARSKLSIPQDDKSTNEFDL